MPSNNSSLVAPSLDAELGNTLHGMHGQLDEAARRSLVETFDGAGYTAIEERAVVAVQKLRLLNGFDLFVVLERGRILRDIENEGLVGIFPGDYNRLEDIAQELGISISEFSDTRTMCDMIFPWMEANFDEPIANVWDRIGKSKFREMVPVLRALISEQVTGSATVANSVELLLQAAHDIAQAGAIVFLDEEGDEDIAAYDTYVREAAIRNVFLMGELPVREMRRAIRPSQTAAMTAVRFASEDGGEDYILLRADTAQVEMFTRVIGGHVDMQVLDADGFTPQVNMVRAVLGAR